MADEIVTITTKMTFGPAMTALNPRQRAFVIAFNNAGGKNATEAGRAAGYHDGPHLRVQVHDLRHDPKIQAAIREDIAARFTEDLAETKSAIDKIAKDTAHPKQFDALKIKLHHGGLIEKTMVQHEHTVTLTFEQKLERAKQLALDAGLDPDKELAGIIDVVPTSVTYSDEEVF